MSDDGQRSTDPHPIIDTDTTVEFIAHHIAQKTRQENPETSIRVKAYEGINKGAIAEA